MEYDGQVCHFGGSMGIGFDAAVCVGVEKLPVKALLNRLGLGKFTYLGVALKLLITSSCDKMKIRLDGETVYRFHKVLFMCAMNGPYEGGGYKFAPEARVDDGLLHVCVASDIPVLKRFFLIPKAAKGKHVGFNGIHMYTCKKVEILSQKPKAIHGDGEPGGPVTKAVVSLETTPISMIY